MCGWCCLPCQIGESAKRMGDSQILCCLTSCFITPVIPLFLLRGKVREEHGIEGSVAMDALAACCCGCCVSTQVANELDDRGK